MPTFSAGWHSYAFKSMLRSRFGNKEALEEAKVSRPPVTSTAPNASFHEGVATKDVRIDDETGLSVRIFLPACCVQPGKINEFGWMMKRINASVAATQDDGMPSVPLPVVEQQPQLAAGTGASSSRGHAGATGSSDAAGSSRSGSSSGIGSGNKGSGSGGKLSHSEAAGSGFGDRSIDAAGNSNESSNEEFWQGINGQGQVEEAEERVGMDAGAADPQAAGTMSRGPSGKSAPREYTGYIPDRDSPHNHRLPIIVQFHGGGFVTGSKDEACNDIICRRLAKVCNSIVISVGYRLAPEHKCPSAYDDGYEVLKWLSRQSILGEVEEDMQNSSQEGRESHSAKQQQHHQKQQQQQQPKPQPPLTQQQQQQQEKDAEESVEGEEKWEGGEEVVQDKGQDEIVSEVELNGLESEREGPSGILRDQGSLRGTSISLGMIQEVADPWIAVHADVSRCLVLGVSSGGNIADQVTRRACTPQGVNDLTPLVLAGQVLLYPVFGGSMRTPSESKSKDAYFYDLATCELVFKLFLGLDCFSLDHPAVNPMLREQLPPGMPPTLLVVAEHDVLTDRAIAYSVFLRNYGVSVQVNSYKDVVHGFASHSAMVHTPQAEACVEDIAMWVTKHVSPKSSPSELSY